MSNAPWQVRFEGSAVVKPVASPTAVLEGIRDGLWEPSDEVRGPGDRDWRGIEDHPLFADPVSEMGARPKPVADDSHLDMNPLIDVALVLLIFFILTTSYASLKRTIDVPAASEDQKQQAPPPEPEKDKVFRVTAWLEAGKPTLKIDEDIIPFAEMEKRMKDMVRQLERNEIILEVDGRLPWGTEASIHDAAKAANIKQIYRKSYKPQ